MDEREIIRQCIKGESRAQKDLYDHFAPLLFAQCLRYARDHPEACDILQESFLSIFKYLHSYRYESPLLHWMRRITSNTAIRYIKKTRRLKFEEDLFASLEDQFPEANQVFEAEDAAYIFEMLNHLPEGYQLVFNLFEIEGFSHIEIADMLNIDPGTSRSQLFKAKKQLKNSINQWNKAI